MAEQRDRRRAVRAGTAAALAVAQPLSTRAARWTGRGTPEIEAASETEGPVTPAGGAFVIWAPLFAGSLLYAGSSSRRRRVGTQTVSGGDWWANAAMAGNVAWSLNSQFRQLDEVSVALILGSATAATTATALAERHPHDQPTRTMRRSFGALAGWLAVASFANIESTLNLRRGRPEEHRAARRAVGLVGAASVFASGASLAVRGNRYFTAAAGWGLGGIAVKAVRHGRTPVASAAGAGLLGLLLSGEIARAHL